MNYKLTLRGQRVLTLAEDEVVLALIAVGLRALRPLTRREVSRKTPLCQRSLLTLASPLASAPSRLHSDY